MKPADPTMSWQLRWARSLAYAAAITCLTQTMPAAAARIDGLAPEQSTSAYATATVHNARLEVKVDDQTIRVAPWPTFLPQRFTRQKVAGNRTMAPAGPIDRLSFTRMNETQPWLLIGNGARSSTRLLEDWRFQLTDAIWSVSNEVDAYQLGRDKSDAAPAMIKAGHQSWCIYLIESHMPKQPQAGIAREDEAQIMWAAWKIDNPHKRCPAQR
jgi:hypothetical protein